MKNTEWLTRREAADWLRVSDRTVTNICQEMEELGLDGIWREGRGFVRINKSAMSNYLYHRKAIRMQGRKDARKKAMAG